MNISKYFSNNNFISSFFLTLLLYLIGYSFTFVTFEGKDDLAMLLISCGYYTGIPESHLIFINVIYGHFLRFLYTIFPNYEWYSIMIVFLQFVSIQFIFYNVFKKFKNFLFIIGLLFFLFSLIINPQFTSTSGLLIIASIFNLYLNNRSENKIVFFISLIFILISSLLRFEVTVFVILVSVIYLYKIFIKDKKIIIYFILLAVLSISAKLYNSYSYENKQYTYYKEYNLLRGNITDSPNSSNLFKTDLSHINNIKKEDKELFSQFIFNNKFDLKTLRELNEILPNKFNFKILKYIDDYKNWLILLSIYFLFLIYYKKYVLIIPFFTLILLFIYVSSQFLPKYRVFSSGILMIFLISAYELKDYYTKINIKLKLRDNNSTNNKAKLINIKLFDWVYINYITYILLIIFSFKIIKIHTIKYKYNDLSFKMLPHDKKYIIYDLGPFSGYRNSNPFKLSQFKEIQFLGSGWLTNSYFQHKQLESWGIKTKLNNHISFIDNEQILKNKNIEFIAIKIAQPKSLKILKKYLDTKNKKIRIIKKYKEFITFRIEDNEKIIPKV